MRSVLCYSELPEDMTKEHNTPPHLKVGIFTFQYNRFLCNFLPAMKFPANRNKALPEKELTWLIGALSYLSPAEFFKAERPLRPR